MIYLAVVTAEGESALHALVLTPVPADGAEQPRRFLWRWNDGGKITWRGWGEVPDALRENQHLFYADSCGRFPHRFFYQGVEVLLVQKSRPDIHRRLLVWMDRRTLVGYQGLTGSSPSATP